MWLYLFIKICVFLYIIIFFYITAMEFGHLQHGESTRAALFASMCIIVIILTDISQAQQGYLNICVLYTNVTTKSFFADFKAYK